jgi:hypothetical protein
MRPISTNQIFNQAEEKQCQTYDQAGERVAQSVTGCKWVDQANK